jgi:hypothetical protein
VGDVLIANDDCSEFGRAAGTAIVISEHSPTGTRAFVVNRPTPLRIRDLDLPFIQRDFYDNVLFFGGDPSNLAGPSIFPSPTRPTVTGGHNLLSSISAPSPSRADSPHSLSPHAWLHPAEDLRGALLLRPGVSCGRSLRDAASAVRAGRADAAAFKFLCGELLFDAGGLQREWDAGLWAIAEDEAAALAIILGGAA